MAHDAKYVAGFDRKVRLVIDWILWPLIGRDITNIRSEESYGVRREHYEPGQEIVRQGEVGRRLFVLWKGEVDVIRESASGPQLLATLGPGQHFGEAAVFEQVRRTATVRARTEVEVLAVGQVEAIALTAIRSFGETVRRTPTLAAYSGDATEDQGEPREEN